MSVTFSAGINVDWEAEETYLNVHNGGYAELMHLLGLPIDEERVGSADAVDLKGRALMALALMGEHVGTESITVAGDGHATFVDCGRAAGTQTHRLTRLMDVCDRAILHGEAVVWS